MNKIFVYILTLFFVLSCDSPSKNSSKPNILFIGVDDLRTELGCYGSEVAVSPNMDALAKDGMLFNRAYCQQAICGPSRASLMTGIRPENSGVIHNYIRFRDQNSDSWTITQQFMKNGYETVYYGKIFHHGDEDSVSWSRPQLTGEKKPVGFALPENIERRAQTRKVMFEKYGKVARFGLAMGAAYECADVPDETYADGYNTQLAIESLKQLAKEDKPFFMGLGFQKPHLNWVAPKKYWDLYDRAKIPLAKEADAPENVCQMGLHPSFELRVRDLIPKEGKIDDELSRTLKHAYLACVSYVDAQIGKVLTTLDELGIRNNTIIILWGDHGWHLGDMGIWGKATNYEVATRVPLMIWTPDMINSSRGKKSDALVELVDMYPTLCELAGIEKPANLEGYSFKPLLENPDKPWKKAVFSQFPTPALREWGAFPLRPAMRETYFGPLINEVEERIIDQQKDNWDRDLFENYLVGYAMRTDRYRFIVWKDRRYKDAEALCYELYDHESDPGETKNIADENPDLIKELMAQFNNGWKGNLPE